MRKTEQEVLMENAISWASRSYCKRLQVGAVIAKEGRVISSGYNGTISGAENCCEEEKYDGFGVELVTKKEAVHAEMNSILFAARDGQSTRGCEIYVTHAPCIDCAKAIIQSGIIRVYYNLDYRDSTGIEFLKMNNIKVLKMEDL